MRAQISNFQHFREGQSSFGHVQVVLPKRCGREEELLQLAPFGGEAGAAGHLPLHGEVGVCGWYQEGRGQALRGRRLRRAGSEPGSESTSETETDGEVEVVKVVKDEVEVGKVEKV